MRAPKTGAVCTQPRWARCAAWIETQERIHHPDAISGRTGAASDFLS
jgi:hypothetical protein